MAGKSVCIVIPDGTRSGPHGLMIQAAYDAIAERAASITILIALGTHAAMEESAIARLLDVPAGSTIAQRFPKATVLNHDWQNPEAIATLGTVPKEEIARLTQGLLTDRDMAVQINKIVAESDLNLVVGPVFPMRWWVSPVVISISSRVVLCMMSLISPTGSVH